MNEVESLFLFFDDDDWPGGALFLVGVPSTGTGLFLVGGGGLVCRSPLLLGFLDCVPFVVSFLFLFAIGLATTFFLIIGFAAGFLSFSSSDSDEELEPDLLSSAELSRLLSLLLLLLLDSLAPLFSSERELSSLLDSDSSSDLSLFSLESSSALDSSFSLSSSKSKVNIEIWPPGLLTTATNLLMSRCFVHFRSLAPSSAHFRSLRRNFVI